MGKKLANRQPLIVTKVEFLPVADDVSKRKIQQVMELLLDNTGNRVPRFEEHIPPSVNNAKGGQAK